MPVNAAVSGTKPGRQRGRRIKGASTSAAKTALQNASNGPRTSGPQSAKMGALANSPQELHISAAARTSSRPENLLGIGTSAGVVPEGQSAPLVISP